MPTLTARQPLNLTDWLPGSVQYQRKIHFSSSSSYWSGDNCCVCTRYQEQEARD